jgi:hypothetical protein
MRVTNGIPLGCPLPLTVTTLNCVTITEGFHDPGSLIVGNWRLPLSEVENVRAFPAGIRDLFDHARAHTAPDGKPMRVIMWTEPERVSPGSYIVRCAFSDRNLRSKMPLDPTHVRLKPTCV